MSKISPYLLLLLPFITGCNEQEATAPQEETTAEAAVDETEETTAEMAEAEQEHGAMFQLQANSNSVEIDSNAWKYFTLGDIKYSEQGYKINFGFNSELLVGDTLGILSMEQGSHYSIIDYFNEDDWQLHPYEGQLNGTSANEVLFSQMEETSNFVFFHPKYAGAKVYSYLHTPIESEEEEDGGDIEEEIFVVALDLNNDNLPDLKIERYSYMESFEGGPVEMENGEGETEYYESYGGGTEYELKETYYVYINNEWVKVKELSWEDFEGC